MFFSPLQKTVILRACDFLDLRVFYTRPDVFQSPLQNRHPERSASQIYRITQGFMARSRRTPAMLLADALPSFPATGYKGNQEDGFMGVPTKNTLKKSARMGRLAVP